MKSSYQHQYEKLIICQISQFNISSEQRHELFLDFYDNNNCYYESLCDHLYHTATGCQDLPFWITRSGEVYPGQNRRREEDVFLASAAEIPAFQGDLIEQLEYILTRIERIGDIPIYWSR